MAKEEVFSDLELWRHHSWSATSGKRHFQDCSCTRKLAQRPTSLVNNSVQERITTAKGLELRQHCIKLSISYM